MHYMLFIFMFIIHVLLFSRLIRLVNWCRSFVVQSMEATKALMNHHLLTKVELSVESECQALMTQWMSPQFDVLSRRFLDTHAPPMQKPVVVPL